MSSMSKVYYKGKQVDFETLPKNEQAFRWALFLESEGYEKNVSKKRIKEIASEYGVTIEE